jgi:2-polyprenyl-6-hydroxyphenyl methylase/3-demethylubiquinone-9 3-methyltransferase
LNGLFVDQHNESLQNREIFTNWVESLSPSRVADFGGGYGTLGRMIAAKCPKCCIEVVDPFPRPEAISISQDYHNLAFSKALNGKYDVVIATDVFEHVTDPIGVAFEVASHIEIGGYFLTANHFAPSIKCHLPATFHFNLSWDHVMKKLGFMRQSKVGYGTAYRKIELVSDIRGARRIERLSLVLDQAFNIKGARRLKRHLLSVWGRFA